MATMNHIRETVLQVIEAIGGHRAFWDEAHTCQTQIEKACAIIQAEIDRHYVGYRKEMANLTDKSAARLRALERIEEYLKDRWPGHPDTCDCGLCQHLRICREAIDL